jgi:hypothetical protein
MSFHPTNSKNYSQVLQSIGRNLDGGRAALLLAGIAFAVSAWASAAWYRAGAGTTMTKIAESWLDGLDEKQRQLAQLEYSDERRIGWHFIPKNDRKGLQLRDMNPGQRAGAHRLLRAALSESGYDKSVRIMELDEILRLQEGANAKNVRDPSRYYFTIFGKPANPGTWGLSVEGHHLSLNFVVRDGEIVDSTPQFMGANPAEVKKQLPGLLNKGVRVLKDEEDAGFELLTAIGPSNRELVLISAEAPNEIRGAGEAQPNTQAPVGLSYSKMGTGAQLICRRLVETYCRNVPEEVASQRLRLIEEAGWENVLFAWAGADKPGIGHYFRLEGPTFVIELINVQADAEMNKANHIHSVWRDRTGDFDFPIQ